MQELLSWEKAADRYYFSQTCHKKGKLEPHLHCCYHTGWEAERVEVIWSYAKFFNSVGKTHHLAIDCSSAQPFLFAFLLILKAVRLPGSFLFRQVLGITLFPLDTLKGWGKGHCIPTLSRMGSAFRLSRTPGASSSRTCHSCRYRALVCDSSLCCPTSCATAAQLCHHWGQKREDRP